MECYSEHLDEAIALAAAAFRGKRRKGTRIPYLAHLLQVLVTVAENGGDEDQMVAAVLHDYLEDVPGADASDLERRFGARVAGLVVGLSDSTTLPKPAWPERKRRYLGHLRTAPPDLKLISVADKLHNARCIRRDLQADGARLWERFNAGRSETLWYYREVVGALDHDWHHPLVAELRDEVRLIHEIADEPWPRA